MARDPSLEEQADQAAAAGQYESARALLEQAVDASPANAELWSKLSAMHNATGDVRAALDALERSLAVKPLDFSVLLSRALILARLGDPAAPVELGRALAQAPPDENIPPPMKLPVAHARKLWAAHQAKLEQHLTKALPAALSPAERQRALRFISNHSRRTRPFHQEASDFHFPGLPEVEFHDRAEFPGLAALEARADAIRGEFEVLIAAEAAVMVPYIQYPERVPLRQWRELNHSRDWTAIHLVQNGARVEANARHCPATLEAAAGLPQPVIPGASPNVMFSLLAPRTRIPPHTGVANSRLVCHLPLIVPPGCGFRVGDTVREWHVGEAFVFDDTIEHEAWNDSDELRVVLILDLWAPALSEAERDAIAAIIGASGVTFMGG